LGGQQKKKERREGQGVYNIRQRKLGFFSRIGEKKGTKTFRRTDLNDPQIRGKEQPQGKDEKRWKSTRS